MHGQSNFYTGNLKYDNNNQTPLVGVPVSLRTFLGYLVASDTTDSSGFFRMSGFPNGSYIVEIDVNYAWGGVTSTDALLVLRYFNNFVSLNPLQIKSGDVNGSNSTNSADALLINRRITGQVGSFSVGNFTSTPSTLNFNGVPITTNIRALAVGDVNKSYTPISTHPTIVLDTVYGNIFMGTATVTFTNSGSGVYERGICWGPSPNPTILSQKVVVGKGGFSFRTSFVSIDPDNIQYVRAYAITSSGVSYSNERSFISTSGPPCPGMVSVNDVEGNIYKTVQIGTQCWMQSNLKVSKYRNGDVIPTGLNNSDWQSTTSGAYSVYNNDPINENWYGKLYNHYSVTDVRGLCPTGWHVPTDSEINTLLGGFGSLAMEALISTGWVNNWSPNYPFFNVAIYPNNISGFSALPGGNRGDDGVYNNLNSLGYWWTSTLDAGFSAKLFYLPNLQRGSYFRPLGISVRCVYDSLMAPTAPLVSTYRVDSITSNRALVSGLVWTSGGSSSITSRGFSYSGPNISRNITFIGNQLGHFSASLDTLTPLTTYSVRAFSTNSIGTGYGNRIFFTTLALPAIPIVNTISISFITSQGATTGGNVTSDGGARVTARGVAYGTIQNPTTANSTTSNGTDTGVFLSTLSGLTASTTYYVRAYAINSVGTSYGNQVSFTTLAGSSNFTCGTSTVSDLNNNTYNTVQIGTQCWTQSNLKVSKYRNGDNIPTGLSNSAWQNATSGAYAIYNNDLVNDGLYGKLYNYYAVTDGRGLCPTGWHVPTDDDWVTLEDYLGGSGVAGGALKSTALQPTPGGWLSPNVGATNSSGFTARPGGTRNDFGVFRFLDTLGMWWSSSVSSGGYPWYRYLGNSYIWLLRGSIYMTSAFSVRCLKDSVSGGGLVSWSTVITTSITSNTIMGAITGGNVTSDGGASVTARGVAYGTIQNPTTANSTTSNGTGTGTFSSTLTGLSPSTTYYVRAYATNSVGTSYGNELIFATSATNLACGTSTVSDVDNNAYNTVQIGNQCWTQSNLKVSKYRNGDFIPTGLINSAWQNTTSGAYAIYTDDPYNDALYGKLYNHYAVTDSRGLCPTGWHVPTDGEWKVLTKYLDLSADTNTTSSTVSTTAGGTLKGTVMQPTPGGWNPPNTGATNSSGFTAPPGGLRSFNGVFSDIASNGYWWSSSVSSGSSAWNRGLNNTASNIYRSNINRTFGFSVRCLNDIASPTVSTTSATGITSTGATTGGNVTSGGGASVTSRGVAYGIAQNPTTANNITFDGTGTGVFTSTLSGLTSLTLYYVRAYATNSTGTAYGSQVSFTTSAVLPTVTTTSATGITSTGATTGGNVTSDGGASVTSRGVAYGTAQNPMTANSTTSNGTGTGVFISTLTGLTGGTLYYVRAYATNSTGTAYGSQVSFTTSAVLPTVTTTSVTGITSTGATTGGNVTSGGGASVTSRGVAYGTAQNPTTANNTTSDGTGTGVFTSAITGLSPSTTYYVRAYATNSTGTAYGSQVSLTTSAAAPQPCPGTPTVTDVDNNTYNTVQIGTQCWTQSNLKVSKYRNGNNIPTGLSNSAWQATISGAYAIYNNDSVNGGLYGKLYNHYAVTDSRGLCPTGWHVPSDAEWTTLENQLGGSSVAGGVLKSTAMQPTPGGWNWPNTGATNSSGFTALPGGLRDVNGAFYGVTINGYWWSSSVSTGGPSAVAWNRDLYYNLSSIYRITRNRTGGHSVRCLKD